MWEEVIQLYPNPDIVTEVNGSMKSGYGIVGKAL